MSARHDPSAADRPVSGASSVGALLRSHRQAARVSLTDVAATLRIRISLLEALEDGAHDRLPGATYAVGFVRSYADYLGLDAEDIVSRFKEERAEDLQRPALNFPSPAPQGRFPGTGALVVSILGLLLLVGGWLAFQDEQGSFNLRVPELPSRLMALLPEASGTSTAASNNPVVTAPPIPAPVPAPGDRPSPAAARATQPATTDAPPSAPAPGPAPAAAGTTPPPVATAAPPGAPLTSGALVAAAAPTGQPSSPQPPAPQAAPPQPPAPQPVLLLPTPPLPPAPLPPPPGDAPRTTVAPALVAAPPPAERTAPEDDSPAPTALTVGAAALSVTEAPTPPAVTPPPPPQPPVLEGRVYGQASADVRVVLRAKGDSWVQVRSSSGEALWSRLLRAGDSYLVPNRNGLVMATGNAGNLDILVDGDVVPSVGDVGVVRRAVALDPERLRTGTAVIANAPPISNN
ncbi:MAG: helix-turn-helix domain-containing protein [Alphaproteobacteria bacterium]|nr:MAG: helix-turn-helix domain-containing protein [Alphaproteobacteria bacterium]